jgi:MFS family permease
MVFDCLRHLVMHLLVRPRHHSGMFRPTATALIIDTNNTQVADIQPNIIQSLGEFEKFPWLATAYAVPASSLVLIQSKLYGLFNIKWLYFGYVVLFEIGSAISGAAPTMNSLIAGRLIAGIGGCGMYIGSLSFFSVITTPKERPIYVSLITPTWGIGTVLGPIVSCTGYCLW